jgi:hypothetical protein
MQYYAVDVYLSDARVHLGLPDMEGEVEAQSEDEAVLRMMEGTALASARCVMVRQAVEPRWVLAYWECCLSETRFSYAWRAPVPMKSGTV